MESVSQNIVVGVIIVIAALVNIACNVYRAVNSGKRTPPATEDIAGVKRDIKTLFNQAAASQTVPMCNQRYGEITTMLAASSSRHSSHEEKISRQIGKLHDRINDVFGELREIYGAMKTHMEKKS